MSYTYQYPRPALKDLPELAFDHDEIMTDAITLYGRLTSKNEKMRTASIADLDEISQLEASCFPEAEAATKETFRWRLNAYPSHFGYWNKMERSFPSSMVLLRKNRT